MGSRTSLVLGKRCEFEANNCLPITWLAIFDVNDFHIENRLIGGDNCEVAVYKTSAAQAAKRAEGALSRLKSYPHVGKFLRPLEIIVSELKSCSADSKVEMDVGQLVNYSEELAQQVRRAPAAFAEMLEAFSGNEKQDSNSLTALVSDLSLHSIDSITDLNPEDRMFILIGTYWGDKEDEYSLAYFGESYWKPIQ